MKFFLLKTIKIGLSFFEPEEKIEDVFENDIKFDYCLTPNGFLGFNDYDETPSY